MASPFVSFANSTLRFQVASGALIEDRNGNLRPGRLTVTVSALLKQARDNKTTEQPGVDVNAIYLEGYLVEPTVLPGSITIDSPCQAIWQGREGRFFYEFTAVNPYLAALNINLVNPIRGWFQPGLYALPGEEEMAGTQYTSPIVASANLSALRIITTNSEGQLIYADSQSSQPSPAIGILLAAVMAGNSIRVLTSGIVSDAAWNWVVNQPLFLGIDGTLTQTPPETGVLLQVATPITPQQINFEIQEPIFL
jgi:hypothetical protein